MNDKAEVMALSDDGDCDDGTVSPTPVTVPKKRGRPSHSDKPKKVPSGRGRGRPAKGTDVGGDKKQSKSVVSADGSEEEGTASDGGSPLPNGDAAEAATVTASKRGRHPNRKHKLTHVIGATGKGRGRPKKIAKTDVVDEDDEADGDDNDEGTSSDYKPGKKATAKAVKKGRGRPKKIKNSDDESSDDKQDDDVVRRPVGRSPSGGVNLNIVRTGKGLGRPKKVDAKRAASENGGGEIGKKPGRPSTSGKGAYVATGKPRGRPKSQVQDKDSQEEDADGSENHSENVAANSADDVEEDDKVNSDSENGI